MKRLLAILLCLLAHVVVAATTVRPNIIRIMADDFGYECVTANGGQSYRTPHLDRLAAGGVRFEQCHVQPLCTPTRVQLMTGRYNVRNYLNFGTHSSVTSRFNGADYQGGKGTTTDRGTHVPFIANWPAEVDQGSVNRDLISSADLLPTICEAAGVKAPANIDGVSFLPQLRGEKGAPREWLYCWYSPRQRLDLTVREFAFNHDHKLYRDGRFFDLRADPFEQQPLNVAALTSVENTARAKLQQVLDQFKDACRRNSTGSSSVK